MRASVAALVLAFCSASASPVFADTQTVTGEVISISCYLHNKANVGRAGYVCALATVKWEGNPAGLLASDGKLYQIAGGLAANNNAKVVPLLSRTVTITGAVSQRAGMTIIEADQAAVASATK